MSITDLESADLESDALGSADPESDAPADDPADGPSQELVADVFARGCTSRAAFDVVTSKWASLALLALGEGSYRFNALRRRVEGVSEKMLSQTLQALERDGMVTRDVVTTIPPRVEYGLTPLGERVAEKLRALADLLEATAAEGALGEAPAGSDGHRA
ncbi:HxlR family transcriptional regulator [Promicromonospora sp. AC04]|uniref:winged helix-turn-helix transcriptional regulator n=1 Tax=Promicromonospora sp. AC04 TaxID=2135723 RepID=UPI000D40A7B1|nr:helix-turn-helix domain-containing protein [Promicromonospora sp. AC04]PUB25018.1 HxlR family transcriptional regulator [Promicromonospora sp. AC04]